MNIKNRLEKVEKIFRVKDDEALDFSHYTYDELKTLIAGACYDEPFADNVKKDVDRMSRDEFIKMLMSMDNEDFSEYTKEDIELTKKSVEKT